MSSQSYEYVDGPYLVDYNNVTTISSLVDVNNNNDETETGENWAKTCYYSVAVPIMLFFCFVSMVTNLCILISIGWVRNSLSPTLRFSVSLAGADAYASLVMGLGLVVNSLLPVTFKVDLGSACYILVLECFRLAGLIISVLHLLLLAFNHYVGIIRPLHYVSTVTRRNAMISIALMWTVPLAFFFIYCSGLPNQGFRSENCSDLSFFVRSRFRILVSCLFFVPLVLMTCMYCHMFIIVQQHNRGFGERRCQRTTRCDGSSTSTHDSRHFRRNIKAAVTTLFILGTYVIGWMPAVVFFVIACHDCAVRLDEMRPSTIFYLAIVTNTLIIVKFFVNPIIYAARMKDIRQALQRMIGSCVPTNMALSSRSSNFDSFDDANSSFVRSRSDTSASTRMHSLYRAMGGGGNKRTNCESTSFIVHQKCVDTKNGRCIGVITGVARKPHNELLHAAVTKKPIDSMNVSDTSNTEA